MKLIILATIFATTAMAQKVPGLGEAGPNSRCSTPIVTCDNCEKQRLQECGINMTDERNGNPERTFAREKGNKKRVKTTAQ